MASHCVPGGAQGMGVQQVPACTGAGNVRIAFLLPEIRPSAPPGASSFLCLACVQQYPAQIPTAPASLPQESVRTELAALTGSMAAAVAPAVQQAMQAALPKVGAALALGRVPWCSPQCWTKIRVRLSCSGSSAKHHTFWGRQRNAP